ncbi:MAG: hypothetical protein ABJA02_07415 [Acidobacteriota bacterium]
MSETLDLLLFGLLMFAVAVFVRRMVVRKGQKVEKHTADQV